MDKRLSQYAWPVLYLLLLAHEAHAYVDPGSGSAMLQVIFGGLAAAAWFLKSTWQRLRKRAEDNQKDSSPPT